MENNNLNEQILTAKDIVISFIKALNNEDFKTAKTYVSEEFTFDGALGSRNGTISYFNDMEKMKLKYDIKKVFANENDVCLLYDFTSNGITIFGCGYYQVKNNKLVSLKVIFDPRPILELQNKK